MSEHVKRTCDQHPDDKKFLEQFHEQVAMLTGMVCEIMEDNPQMLLSPIFRRMLADKARLVASMHGPLKNRLCVDNPGEPLKPWPSDP